MDYFQRVGKNIQEVLEERSMKQTDLALRLGVSRQMVHKIVNGRKAINIREISLVADILSVSVDELIGRIPSTSWPELQADAVRCMGESKNDTEYEFVNSIIEDYILLEDRLNDPV
jgi:transcriptional regulator with XRE-family HTH domain